MHNPGDNLYPVLTAFQTYLKNCDEKNVCMACERPLWIDMDALKIEVTALKAELETSQEELEESKALLTGTQAKLVEAAIQLAELRK